MLQIGIHRIVFSSTAAILGNPKTDIIREDHPKNSINPYGRTKLLIENFLNDLSITRRCTAIYLRYFNAAGADPEGGIGGAHDPETHLIPTILDFYYRTQHPFKVFGNNYPTSDGTCILDYVHVNDLADAHILALEKLQNIDGFYDYNLGSSVKSSIMEVIKSCDNVTGRLLNYEIDGRRSGDAAVLVANNKKALTELGWKPVFNNLDRIIETAWNWHKRL